MPESLPGAGVSLFIWEVRKAKTQAGLARRVGTSLSPDQSKPRYAKACLFCASDSPCHLPRIIQELRLRQRLALGEHPSCEILEPSGERVHI